MFVLAVGDLQLLIDLCSPTGACFSYAQEERILPDFKVFHNEKKQQADVEIFSCEATGS